MERHDQFQGSDWRSRAFYGTNYLHLGTRNNAISYTNTFSHPNGKPNTVAFANTVANS